MGSGSDLEERKKLSAEWHEVERLLKDSISRDQHKALAEMEAALAVDRAKAQAKAEVTRERDLEQVRSFERAISPAKSRELRSIRELEKAAGAPRRRSNVMDEAFGNAWTPPKDGE